uniref:Uncharacterized protein n=1 Tax=Cacopsylla melanoneura TaxID=428564 RepID=A0A8D8YHK4_9HEMI
MFDFRSIKAFPMQFFTLENRVNISARLFHLVLQSRINSRRFSFSSTMYFCKMVSFFVGEYLKTFTVLRTFSMISLKLVLNSVLCSMLSNTEVLESSSSSSLLEFSS